jgi:Bacterial Ig domain
MSRRAHHRATRLLAPAAAIFAVAAAAGIALAIATAGDVMKTLNEDATGVAIDLTGTTDTGAGSITYTVVSEPSHGSIDEGTNATGSMACSAGNCSATIHYTPTADANGADSFTYKTSDTDGDSTTATVTLTITAVNDVPSFTAGSDVTVLEDSGAYSGTWATNVSAGPTDEQAVQTVDFELTSDDNAALFSVAPAIAADGTLSFTPAPDAFGSATVGFKIHDDGGTANGGVDLSAAQTFTINVTGVNDAPSFTPGSDEIVNHDSGAFTATGWATNIDAGPGEGTQTVSFSVTADDNVALFSVAPAVASDGTLTFTVAAAKTGTANLTLQAHDDGGTANGGVDTSASVPVVIRVNANPNAVNDSASVEEGSTTNVISVLGNDTSLPDPPEALTVTGVSNDNVLGPFHGSASVTVGGGSVTYTPTANYYGSDFFRYTITDPYGGTDFATVFVTINKDSTPPTVSLPAQGIKTVTTMSSTNLSGVLSWSGSDTGVGILRFEVQRSTNGGAFASLTLPTLTSTSMAIGLNPTAAYQFRVRAVDKNGNTSAWMTGPKFVQARYQETTGFIKYSAGWTLTSNASDSGGGAKYASTAGRWASFTHVVRDVAIVGPRSSTRGSFDVYIDGVKTSAAAMHFTTTKYQQVVWQFHFAKIGTHTIKIVLRGNGRVDLDAFVILT